MSEKKRWYRRSLSSPVRLLSLALTLTLLLMLAALSAMALAVVDSLRGTAEIARREERTAYLVATIVRDTARMRGALAEATTDPLLPVEQRLADAYMLRAEIESARTELAPLLAEPERAVWLDLQPGLDRMLDAYAIVTNEIERGREGAAERRLDAVADETHALHRGIDRFQYVTLQDTEDAIADIQSGTRRSVVVTFAVSTLLIAMTSLPWLFVLRWVARQRRLLDQQMQDLEARNRDLDAFAGRVAHDMRNVLTPITLGVALLEQSSEAQPVLDVATRIGRSCARGRDLVEGLLAFSRAGVGEPEAPDRSDMASKLDDVLEQLDDAIREAGVTVETQVPDAVDVALSPALLHVVLLNLVGNAVKFMRGSPRRELTITVRPHAAAVEIAITDTGPGIAAEHRERVFEPFFRAPAVERTAGGLGLGLATVKRLVESHGGSVRVTSPPDRGATFIVSLPRPAEVTSEHDTTQT